MDTINIKGNVVTIDAMGTQTAIAEKIKLYRADYVLAVKKTQKNLYGEISEYFEKKEFLKKARHNSEYKKTQEKSHSQIKIREYYQCSKINWMKEKIRWKGIKSIGMVQKAAQNLNIIHKWGLSILKLFQIETEPLSTKAIGSVCC